MSSFKLEKTGSAKSEATSAGVFMALIGVPVMLVIEPTAGLVMVLLGTLIAVAGKFASE